MWASNSITAATLLQVAPPRFESAATLQPIQNDPHKKHDYIALELPKPRPRPVPKVAPLFAPAPTNSSRMFGFGGDEGHAQEPPREQRPVPTVQLGNFSKMQRAGPKLSIPKKSSGAKKVGSYHCNAHTTSATDLTRPRC